MLCDPFLDPTGRIPEGLLHDAHDQALSASEACAIDLVDELTDHLEESLRRLTLRLNLLDDNTIVDMKRYFQKMGGITLELEQAATTEIARLVAQPHVRQNIANYVTQGAFPWERKV